MKPVVAKLNIALNRSANSPLPTPEPLPAKSRSLSDKTLFPLLRENNPNLKALDILARKEALGIRLAGKNYFPDMTLGVDYTVLKKVAVPGLPRLQMGRFSARILKTCPNLIPSYCFHVSISDHFRLFRGLISWDIHRK